MLNCSCCSSVYFPIDSSSRRQSPLQRVYTLVPFIFSAALQLINAKNVQYTRSECSTRSFMFSFFNASRTCCVLVCVYVYERECVIDTVGTANCPHPSLGSPELPSQYTAYKTATSFRKRKKQERK